MKRKQILSTAVIVLSVCLLALILTALMPFWLTAWLIYPSLLKPLVDYTSREAMRSTTKIMMRGMKMPTMGVK